MKEEFNIPSIDGLRAVSIAIVFIAHAGYGYVILGGFGVTVFFFLSGYLITTLLAREWGRYGSISLEAFYLRRVLRLGPPILMTICVSSLLVFLGVVDGRPDFMTTMSQIFFFYNYFSLTDAGVETATGLNVLWSLAVEEHFYLVWPALFILLAAGRFGVRHQVALLVAILIWRGVRYAWFGSDEWTIYISTDTRFDSLLYGCVLALLTWRGYAARIFRPGVVARVGWVAVGLVVSLACLLIRDPAFRSILRYSLQGLALTPIFHYAVTNPADPWFRPLNWPALRRIGQWSYTIYLIHYVIISALIYNGVAASGDPLLIAAAAALSITFAAASYRWLEKPLHPLRRRLTGH